jgi:hypothetical protein
VGTQTSLVLAHHIPGRQNDWPRLPNSQETGLLRGRTGVGAGEARVTLSQFGIFMSFVIFLLLHCLPTGSFLLRMSQMLSSPTGPTWVSSTASTDGGEAGQGTMG